MKKGLFILILTVFLPISLLGMQNSQEVDSLTSKLENLTLNPQQNQIISLFTTDPRAIKVSFKTAMCLKPIAAIINRTHEIDPRLTFPYQAYDISELGISYILSPILQILEKLSENMSHDTVRQIMANQSGDQDAIKQCNAILDQYFLKHIMVQNHENYHALFNATQQLELPFLTRYLFKKCNRNFIYTKTFKHLPQDVIDGELLKFVRHDATLLPLYYKLLSHTPITSLNQNQPLSTASTGSKQYTALEINGNKDIGLYDTANNLVYTCTGHRKPINDFAWSHNGNYLASASEDNTIKIWHVANVPKGQKEIQAQLSLTGFNKSHAIAWSPDDNYLAIGSCNGSIAIVDVQESCMHRVLELKDSNCVNKLDWPTQNTIVSMEKSWDLTNFYAMHNYLHQQTTFDELMLLQKYATHPDLTFDDLDEKEKEICNHFASVHPAVNNVVKAALNTATHNVSQVTEASKNGCIIS